MEILSSWNYWGIVVELSSVNYNDNNLSSISYEKKEKVARYCANFFIKCKGYHDEMSKRLCQLHQEVYNKLYKSLNPQDKNKFDSQFQDMKKTIEKEAGDQPHEEAYNIQEAGDQKHEEAYNNIQEAGGHLQALVGPVKTVSVLVAAVMAYMFSRRQYRRLFQQTAR